MNRIQPICGLASRPMCRRAASRRRNLVTKGDTASGGKITACVACMAWTCAVLAPCHPRRPFTSYIARQLYDMKKGNRNGAWTAMMAPSSPGMARQTSWPHRPMRLR